MKLQLLRSLNVSVLVEAVITVSLYGKESIGIVVVGRVQVIHLEVAPGVRLPSPPLARNVA